MLEKKLGVGGGGSSLTLQTLYPKSMGKESGNPFLPHLYAAVCHLMNNN